MFCGNCGRQIDDSSKFCPFCGTVIEKPVEAVNTPPAADDSQTSDYSQPDLGAADSFAPQEPAYSYDDTAPDTAVATAAPAHGKGLRILLGGLIVLAVILAVVLVVVLRGGAKGAVLNAFAKSASAYSKAYKDAGFPDLRERYESGKWSQHVRLSVDKASNSTDMYYYGPDLSGLENVGLSYDIGLDLEGQKLSFSAAPTYGSAELINLQFVMDGSEIYFASPELTDGTSYGVDTKTLGRDMAKLGADDEVETLSFNTFELIEQLRSDLRPDEEAKKELQTAGKDLWAEVMVEKTGKESVDVNDKTVKCTAYEITIPESALKDYLDALEDYLRSADTADALYKMVDSMGLPDYAVDEMRDSMRGADTAAGIRETFDGLNELVDEIGDIELKAYIKGGRIMALTYEDRIEGSDLDMGLYLGGGKEYVDDIGFVLRVDGGDTFEMELRSTGNHAARGGEFTDETTLEIGNAEFQLMDVTSEMRYAAREKSDNFSWNIEDIDAQFEVEGQLNAGKGTMDLTLDRIRLSNEAMSMEMSADFSVDEYKAAAEAGDPVLLSSLDDEDDLYDILLDIQENAERWAMGLQDRLWF